MPVAPVVPAAYDGPPHEKWGWQMTRRGSAAAVATVLILIGVAAAQASELKKVGQVTLPTPSNEFSTASVDSASGLMFLPDRTNKAVVVIDTNKDAFVADIGGFTGIADGRDRSGPNSIVAVDGQAWVADGDSTVKIVDLKTRKIVASLPTGGAKRTLELAYDPDDGVMLASNPDDTPPFVTLMATARHHRIVGMVALPGASAALERVLYAPARRTFLIAIPQISGNAHRGALAEIDPRRAKLVALHTIADCAPHGLSLAGKGRVFVGCHAGSPDTGLKMPVMIVYDLAHGRVLALIPGLGGAGETAADQSRGVYYVATGDDPKGPALGVIDAETNKLVQRIATWTGSHALALAPSGKVYLPTRARSGPCGGCVLVYAQQ